MTVGSTDEILLLCQEIVQRERPTHSVILRYQPSDGYFSLGDPGQWSVVEVNENHHPIGPAYAGSDPERAALTFLRELTRGAR